MFYSKIITSHMNIRLIVMYVDLFVHCQISNATETHRCAISSHYPMIPLFSIYITKVDCCLVRRIG